MAGRAKLRVLRGRRSSGSAAPKRSVSPRVAAAVHFGGRARQPPEVAQEPLHRAQRVDEVRERQRVELQPPQLV